jgi:hypothetical protein
MSSLTIETITAAGQPLLDAVEAMPAWKRNTDAVATFLVAKISELPEEMQEILTESLVEIIETRGLIKNSYNELTSEEFMAAMNSGDVCWGDLCMDAPMTSFVEEDEEPIRELEYGWDFEYPALKLRKDIWTNFPVTVEIIGTGADGAERHAVCWHRKNFKEWRETRPETYDEWMNYEDITAFRLMKCLEASTSWTVEETADPNVIAILRMNFEAPAAPALAKVAEEDEEDDFITVFAKKPHSEQVKEANAMMSFTPRVAAPAPRVAAPAPRVASAYTGPVLARINDITAHFPTCWNNETRARSSARTGDIISISIHNTKLRESGADRATVERDLMAALKNSRNWRVLPAAAGSREFCRLEML